MYAPICYLTVRFFTAKQVRLEGIQSLHVHRVPIFHYLFGAVSHFFYVTSGFLICFGTQSTTWPRRRKTTPRWTEENTTLSISTTNWPILSDKCLIFCKVVVVIGYFLASIAIMKESSRKSPNIALSHGTSYIWYHDTYIYKQTYREHLSETSKPIADRC